VTHSFHGYEVQSIERLNIASHLTVNHPRPPFVNQREVEFLEPSLGSVGRDSAISVARVVEHADASSSEDFVDPERTFLLVVPVLSNVAIASLVGRHILRNVELFSHSGVVEEIRDSVSQNNFTDEGVVLEPGSVLFLSVASLVGHLLASDHSGSVPLGRRSQKRLRSGVVLRHVVSVEIVQVDSIDEAKHVVEQFLALVDVACGREHVSVVKTAVLFLERLEHLSRHGLEVEESVRVNRLSIHVPFGSSVAHHEASEVVGGEQRVNFGLEVVLVDLPGKVGDVDASVALTSDEEFVVHEVGEFLKELDDGLETVVGGGHVVVSARLVVGSKGESHTSRGFQVEHVGLGIPGVGVRLHFGFEVVNDVGTVLLDHAQHRRAARTSIHPNDERVVGGVILGLNKDVVEGLIDVDFQVARVSSGVHGDVAQLSEHIFSGLGSSKSEGSS
jgi:hypothetical protein